MGPMILTRLDSGDRVIAVGLCPNNRSTVPPFQRELLKLSQIGITEGYGPTPMSARCHHNHGGNVLIYLLQLNSRFYPKSRRQKFETDRRLGILVVGIANVRRRSGAPGFSAGIPGIRKTHTNHISV